MRHLSADANSWLAAARAKSPRAALAYTAVSTLADGWGGVEQSWDETTGSLSQLVGAEYRLTTAEGGQ